MERKFIVPLEVLEEYQGLIFDMDGTIFDTIPAYTRAWQDASEIYGYPFRPEVMIRMTGSSTRDIAKAVMEDAGMDLSLLDELVSKKMKLSENRLIHESTTLPAFELVKYYKGKKPLGLGTGSGRNIIEILHEKFQVEDYFEGNIVSAEDVTKHKPDPETWLKVADLMSVDPKECICFEDGLYGREAALAIGMDCFDVNERRLYKAVKPIIF